MTDTPQVLLAHHLKTLKLPTFLREYDKLARQCATEGADHVRYLVHSAVYPSVTDGAHGWRGLCSGPVTVAASLVAPAYWERRSGKDNL